MPRHTLWLLVAVSLVVSPALAQVDLASDDDGLEELLTQVGEEYAIAYTTPLIHSFGANQNSALFHTADIPRSSLTFSVGVKVMGTYLSEDDQTFRRVIRDVDLTEFFDLQPGDPGFGQTGDIVLEGPTVMGDTEEKGTITGYVAGLPIVQEEGIEGLVDTRWVPMFAPEVQVGGVAGLKASLRWLPEIDLSDYGKTKYLGYGLQWNVNTVLPPMPVDIMVGFFTQQIDVGTIVETDATSFYAAASKQYGIATVYGGLAAESSTMKVSYTEEGTDTTVDFELDGDNKARFTLGTTLNLGAMLNAEIGFGKLTVFSAGLMFGM
jgi:hypothetical protein